MKDKKPSPPPLSRWPLFDLVTLGRELGLQLDENMAREKLLDAIRERQELILELEEDWLRDILGWAGIETGPAESRENLARQVATIRKMRFTGLSDKGLYALARLRGVYVDPKDDRREVIRRIKRAESIPQKLGRKTRRLVGAWIGRALVGGPTDDDAPDQSKELVRSFKDSLENDGIVSGLAGKIRGVADDYVAQKLDEIEQRIDRKLDDIDRRLAEWRDREVATRLRIIKITLIVSVLVALLSLGYTFVKHRVL